MGAEACMGPARFASLRQHRAFRTLWLGQAISGFGTQVTQLALPLTAALLLEASPGQMGLLVASQQVPSLLFGLPLGAWVDRHRKRPILIAAELGRAIVLAGIPLAYLLGLLRLEYLYAVSFLLGILGTCSGTAYAPFLLAVVSRTHILEANSKLSQSTTAALIAGPGLAGLLVQAISAPFAILADALSFLVSAVTLWLVRVEELTPQAPAPHRNTWREIGEGMRFVAESPLLRALASTRSTWEFFDNVILAVLVLYVTRELGLGAGLLGFVFIGGPVGFLVSSALSGRATRRHGVGPAAVRGAVISSAGALLYILAAGPTPFAITMLLAAEFSMGYGSGLYSVTTNSLRQVVTPDRLLGRMNASFTFLSRGIAPLGALAGGALGEAIGLRPTLIVGAIGEVAGFLWVWYSPLSL
jgi:MFS family permease